MSVVKYGLPVPAAKMTTRPFSRWRMARRRMNGSATARISIAVTTRVTLGTEVLVLPQRQVALVAKQVSTLDTLSGEIASGVVQTLATKPIRRSAAKERWPRATITMST